MAFIGNTFNSYDAWGNVIKSGAQGAAAENPFLYAGYMYDKEINMYYLMARYYQPEQGVFLSLDPQPGNSDDSITQNGYSYANNNPVMNVDPDGNSSFKYAAELVGSLALDALTDGLTSEITVALLEVKAAKKWKYHFCSKY
ncbi:RHS repeat-associated core domain-containing protein [Bacillus sp. RG28]|uniref:RHS repeat-associated core domain-containing protein n=1 Tax=Gottfriedia endophytica TaxID=2820819 RepID=A0A940SII8_9BACI|nr:RHS repeat-associated core domain-containing protein [Gottfriedia endophytica]MBP0727352.1 RHS repeat-associated core domain-containing protein [Gottfriedia endophytica]